MPCMAWQTANNDLSVTLQEVGRYLEDHVTCRGGPGESGTHGARQSQRTPGQRGCQTVVCPALRQNQPDAKCSHPLKPGEWKMM
jgi:hypothetical protein